MMNRRRFLQVATGALPVLARTALAQGYPSRPVTVIVPTGAGGPQDVIARIVIEHMRAPLGQPLVIENVSGANGSVGIAKVARAKPDGYTLTFSLSSATHVVNAAIYALPYDVVHDFAPVAPVAAASGFITSRKSLPANSLQELIAWLQANPDKASLGQTGPGSPAHVAGMLLQRRTGTRFQFVNYRSAGQAMQDMIAGHIDLMFGSPSIALEHVRAGRIKAYAVTTDRRLSVAPDIPTVDEAGLPGFYNSTWYALWAPAHTPRDVILKLNNAAIDALADEAVRARFAGFALEAFPREQQTPEALRALQKAEIERLWPILKEAGIKGE